MLIAVWVGIARQDIDNCVVAIEEEVVCVGGGLMRERLNRSEDVTLKMVVEIEER